MCECMYKHIPGHVSVHTTYAASIFLHNWLGYMFTICMYYLLRARMRARKRRRREARAVLAFCSTYCALSQINNSLHVYLTKGNWRVVEANPRHRSQRSFSD